MKHISCTTTILVALATVLASSTPCLAQSGSRPAGHRMPYFIAIDRGGTDESTRELDAGYQFLCDHTLPEAALQKAVVHFQKAIKVRPSDHAYIGLMLAYVELGNYKEAVAAYRTVLDDPKSAHRRDSSWVELPFALALSKTGQDAQALEVLRRFPLKSALPVPLPDLGADATNRPVSGSELQAIAHVRMVIAEWDQPAEQQIRHARMAVEALPNSGWAHYYYARTLAVSVTIGPDKTAEFWEKVKAEFDSASRLGNADIKKEVELFRERLWPGK